MNKSGLKVRKNLDGYNLDFVNAAMVIGVLPVVGIPLPLISYGGTVMLSIIISIGMVLNIELNHNLKKLSDHAQG